MTFEIKPQNIINLPWTTDFETLEEMVKEKTKQGLILYNNRPKLIDLNDLNRKYRKMMPKKKYLSLEFADPKKVYPSRNYEQIHIQLRNSVALIRIMRQLRAARQ